MFKKSDQPNEPARARDGYQDAEMLLNDTVALIKETYPEYAEGFEACANAQRECAELNDNFSLKAQANRAILSAFNGDVGILFYLSELMGMRAAIEQWQEPENTFLLAYHNALKPLSTRVTRILKTLGELESAPKQSGIEYLEARGYVPPKCLGELDFTQFEPDESSASIFDKVIGKANRFEAPLNRARSMACELEAALESVALARQTLDYLRFGLLSLKSDAENTVALAYTALLNRLAPRFPQGWDAQLNKADADTQKQIVNELFNALTRDIRAAFEHTGEAPYAEWREIAQVMGD